MYKSILNFVFRNKSNVQYFHIRNFLSESYKCTIPFNKRLESNLLNKVSLDELTYSLEQNYQKKELISSIDMDVLANAIKDDNYLNELRDLIHKFRNTKEATNMLPSTNYATIRHFIDNGKLEELLTMLDDRLNYGLFLDDYTGNLLLDEFIKQSDFTSAAKVASLFMLQEDFGNEITENLSLYACYKYFQNLKPEEPTATEEPVKKKKEEEIRVRVRYLINPYFDDHFDLRDHKSLVGKTLSMLTFKNTDAFSLNCQLIGWLFYKKVDKLNNVSQKIIQGGLLFQDTLKILELALQQNHIREDENILPLTTQLVADLQNVNKESKGMEEIIVKKIEESLNKHQDEHIHKHSQLFQEWEKIRIEKFQQQVTRIEEAKRLAEEEAREEELRDIEEKLWFLENEEKVDMKIEENERILEEQLKLHPKKGLAKEEEYIPPEIVKQTTK